MEQATIGAINRWFTGWYPKDLFFPNMFAVSQYIESDLIRVTPSGYMYEYEIKHSLADLRADKRKTGKHAAYLQAYLSQGLRSTKLTIPKEFYYVLAIGEKLPKLSAKQAADLIPDYAGLIYAHPYIGRADGQPYASCDFIRNAPRLSRQPIAEEKLADMQKKINFRFWELEHSRKYREYIERLNKSNETKKES